MIAGLEDGISRMSTGQICIFQILPSLAYGVNGYLPVVPLNATLSYEVEPSPSPSRTTRPAQCAARARRKDGRGRRRAGRPLEAGHGRPELDAGGVPAARHGRAASVVRACRWGWPGVDPPCRRGAGLLGFAVEFGDRDGGPRRRSTGPSTLAAWGAEDAGAVRACAPCRAVAAWPFRRRRRRHGLPRPVFRLLRCDRFFWRERLRRRIEFKAKRRRPARFASLRRFIDRGG